MSRRSGQTIFDVLAPDEVAVLGAAMRKVRAELRGTDAPAAPAAASVEAAPAD